MDSVISYVVNPLDFPVFFVLSIIVLYRIFEPIVSIPDGYVGVVKKGFRSVEQIVSPGQRGIQPGLLGSGAYVRPSWTVEAFPLVVIPDGCVGLVTSHIGLPPDGRTARYQAQFGDFTDIERFLDHGGQQGVQEAVLPPGSYAIHPYAFEVIVLAGEGETQTVYGHRATATAELYDYADVYTAGQQSFVVIRPYGESTAVSLADGCNRAARVVTYIVTTPTPTVTIEWEVAVPIGHTLDIQQIGNNLTTLACMSLEGSERWSVAEIAATLRTLELRSDHDHFVSITEAVILPRVARV